MTFLLVLFAKWKSALWAIALLAGSLVGLKFYAGAKKNRKNERKLAILEGKEKVASGQIFINDQVKKALKEIDDEESEGILARLNKRGSSK